MYTIPLFQQLINLQQPKWLGELKKKWWTWTSNVQCDQKIWNQSKLWQLWFHHDNGKKISNPKLDGKTILNRAFQHFQVANGCRIRSYILDFPRKNSFSPFFFYHITFLCWRDKRRRYKVNVVIMTKHRDDLLLLLQWTQLQKTIQGNLQ